MRCAGADAAFLQRGIRVLDHRRVAFIEWRKRSNSDTGLTVTFPLRLP